MAVSKFRRSRNFKEKVDVEGIFMNQFYHCIKSPIISEKLTLQSETFPVYGFKVDVKANKFQIKQAIEQAFNVKVKSIKTMIVHGKVKRSGKNIFKRKNWKKAIVALKDNQKIEFFQGA